jgi:hypothetical protein
MSSLHQPATGTECRSKPTRSRAGKLKDSIGIGFQRESFVTEAERFAAQWVNNASLGTPNLRHGD